MNYNYYVVLKTMVGQLSVCVIMPNRKILFRFKTTRESTYLRLEIGSGALCSSDDYVRHTIAELRRATRVTLAHAAHKQNYRFQ